jgi:FkbM family methyltransferase
MDIQNFISKIRREAAPSLISVALSSAGQYYRFPEIRHLRQMVDGLKIDCIFDVGANEGQYARMLRRWVGFRGRIISFEPNPDVLAKLSMASKNDPLWTVEPLALSSVSGKVTFNATSDTQFGSIEKPVDDEQSALRSHLSVTQRIEVESETLESAFVRLRERYGFERPLLKMDTQGHDLSVFRSGINIIENFVALQSELSFLPFYDNVPLFDETLTEYKICKFKLSAIFQNNRGHFPLLREMDCLMVNDKYL